MKDMKTHPIGQEPLPPDLKWPRVQWRINLWLDLISVLLAFIVLFWPGLVQEGLEHIRFLVGIPLLLVPLLVPVLPWLCKVSYVVCRRAHYYPTLRQRAQREIDKLNEMEKNLFDIALTSSAGHLFEIARAGCYEDKLWIVLNKPKSPKLAEGDALLVAHIEDGRAMGLFEVTQVRDTEYYAIGISSVDALWWGYVRQQGEVTIMPHMAAIHVPQGETK
jgi:hypothetical protein